MANILSLPQELLLKIFKYIDSNLQLAQCRLVCSRWSEPANTTMFSNTIVLSTKEMTLALYGQLFSDPAKGRLMHNIYFKKEFSAFWIFKAMFNAAPLPNIETLDGSHVQPDFYNTLHGIIQENPAALNKLRVLPRYNEIINQTYCDVLLGVRNTLSALHINNRDEYINGTMRTFAPQLNAFGNLTALHYEGKFGRLSDVDAILKECIHLKTLTLNTVLDGPTQDKTIVGEWLTQEVTQVASLVELSLERQYCCDLVEYLSYKYPNLTNITLYSGYATFVSADELTLFTGYMDRILQAIEGIPHKKLSF
ncbi:hypothetical protein MBANPS3_004154 [Mucor bainieri]